MILRRIAAVLRPPLFWLVGWAVTGAMLSIVVGIVDPPSIDPGEGPVDVARILGGVGGACGLVFGVLLVVLERDRAVASVPLVRAALWGLVAGALVPLVIRANVSVLATTCPFGAFSGLIYVAAARLRSRKKLDSSLSLSSI